MSIKFCILHTNQRFDFDTNFKSQLNNKLFSSVSGKKYFFKTSTNKMNNLLQFFKVFSF